jgi:lactococcin 972 family bacteriocin
MNRMIVAGALVFALATATPVLATTENVGGGTWNYGWVWNAPWPEKIVYSQYVHPTKYHSSTAICSINVSKVYATAGNWSDARVMCGLTDQGHYYWNTY